MPGILANKRIILGITGSIAAYKAAILASHLTQEGAQVDTIMTEAAARFITPLTLQALTGRPVYISMWNTDQTGGLDTHIAHVGLAHEADLLLIAPVTANTIAKLALGLADDLLSVTALAAACPVLIAPAMDAGMYENAATQSHIQTLQERGISVAGPAIGRMASGLEGLGRFLPPEDIIGHCRRVLGQTYGSLIGRQVIVTAGPTQESIDPVRFITNHSSGKQGYAVAQAAVDAGADVTLISGPTAAPVPVGLTHIPVKSTYEMHKKVLSAVNDGPVDVLIMAAAVADFRPETVASQKLKKSRSEDMNILLTRNPDILMDVSQQERRPHVTVGFAAESQDLIDNAREKLEKKKLDLIVANDITAQDAGFAVSTNRVIFITTDQIEELPLMSKEEVAGRIIQWVATRL